MDSFEHPRVKQQLQQQQQQQQLWQRRKLASVKWPWNSSSNCSANLPPDWSVLHRPETERNDVHPLEFIYLVFTRMPGESYHGRLRSLFLYLCYVFRAQINSPVCWFSTDLFTELSISFTKPFIISPPKVPLDHCFNCPLQCFYTITHKLPTKIATMLCPATLRYTVYQTKNVWSRKRIDNQRSQTRSRLTKGLK